MNDDGGGLYLDDILTPEEIRELAQLALNDPTTEYRRQRLVLAGVDALIERVTCEAGRR